MIDHVGVTVRNVAKSRAFYEKALAPLGIRAVAQHESFVGFGSDAKPVFWIGEGESHPAKPADHVAFAAATRAQVREFYKAALAAGGRDHGAPGLRAHYHAHYYAAFVIDFDGYNVEAVCHLPE